MVGDSIIESSAIKIELPLFIGTRNALLIITLLTSQGKKTKLNF